MKDIHLFVKLLIVLSFFVLIPSCAINPVTGRQQLMFMSEEREVELGKQYDPKVLDSFGEYEDEELLSFIREKGDAMGKVSHRPQLKFHFRILDTPVVNAFAVPGGYVYFTRGILAQFNNEAELMGVLGHEMGHITARHSVSQQSKQQLGQLLMVGGMIASEDFRKYAGYAMQGMELLFLSFSRSDEREADRLGVEYASKIMYDAQKMADFFNVLNRMNMKSSHGGIPTFLSTHPDPGDRYETVSQQADQWKEKLGYERWMINEKNYLNMLDGLVYGNDPRQGYVQNNMFYHPQMKFYFPVPQKWELENSPMQVQMASEDGKAAIIFMQAQQNSLEQATNKTISDLGLKLIDKENIEVNGFRSLKMTAEQLSEDQKKNIKVLSYFIQDGQKIYVFHGIATKQNFENVVERFEMTMMNFKRLEDKSKINVKPQRIRVKEVQKDGKLEQVFVFYNVEKKNREKLAILNNMELNDEVKRGKLIKIIGE